LFFLQDFTNIQAAINALPPAGGKIFVKAGTYVASRTIRITSASRAAVFLILGMR
jgi:hypothetical protein